MSALRNPAKNRLIPPVPACSRVKNSPEGDSKAVSPPPPTPRGVLPKCKRDRKDAAGGGLHVENVKDSLIGGHCRGCTFRRGIRPRSGIWATRPKATADKSLGHRSPKPEAAGALPKLRLPPPSAAFRRLAGGARDCGNENGGKMPAMRGFLENR